MRRTPGLVHALIVTHCLWLFLVMGAQIIDRIETFEKVTGQVIRINATECPPSTNPRGGNSSGICYWGLFLITDASGKTHHLWLNESFHGSLIPKIGTTRTLYLYGDTPVISSFLIFWLSFGFRAIVAGIMLLILTRYARKGWRSLSIRRARKL